MTRDRARPRCFISHKFGDPALDACLARTLPLGASPVVFNRIDETQDIGITSPLMEAIRDCELVAYLDTPASLASFWVGLERSYAARIGKPVYAYRPQRGLFASAFTQDQSASLDPVVSLLVNLQIKEDVERLLNVLKFARERDRLEFLGLDQRQVDDEPRHLLDSTDNMELKLRHGGVALLFLSTESIESGWHDYADAFTAHRAKRDFDTPTGTTAQRFAALPPDRTLVCWLGPPDDARIHRALAKFAPDVWANYLRTVREALQAPKRCILFGAGGAPDRSHVDYMIARAYWQALQVDPVLAADFRAELRGQKRRPTAQRPDFETHAHDRGWPRPGIV